MAKLVCTDAAMQVTTDAVQVLGGAGYTQDFPLERYMREAKVTQIFEGTNQIQRLVISRHLLADRTPERSCHAAAPPTVALVTGGGSGLGGATARRLVADGAKVVIVDLECRRAPALVDELGASGSGFVPADVRDEAQVQAAVDRRVRSASCAIAVNCAGVATPGRVIGRNGPLSARDFQTVIDINLVGSFNVLRLAAAAMLANEPVDGDRGVIVNTASIAAYDGQIGQAAYAASKGGIVGLTLSAARDLADKAIRVMTIAPGTFETPMLAGLPERQRRVLEKQVPHPSRLGKPEEYASLVRHIVDNPMLNGEVIRLDGALRMPPR